MTVEKVKFPDDAVRAYELSKYGGYKAMSAESRYYKAAAVCRRGHIEDFKIDVGKSYRADKKCDQCGADVLIGCTRCDMRIKGDYSVGGFWRRNMTFVPPKFCDECGCAHPWTTRVEKIMELENILAQRDLDEDDRSFISGQLRKLRELGDAEEEKAEAIWKTLAKRAKWFILSPETQPIIETLSKVAIDFAK